MKTIIYRVLREYETPLEEIFDTISDPLVNRISKQASKYDLCQIEKMIDCVLNDRNYTVEFISYSEAAERQDKIDEEEKGNVTIDIDIEFEYVPDFLYFATDNLSAILTDKNEPKLKQRSAHYMRSQLVNMHHHYNDFLETYGKSTGKNKNVMDMIFSGVLCLSKNKRITCKSITMEEAAERQDKIDRETEK